MNGLRMDELNRKICGWLLRGGGAALAVVCDVAPI